jgi:hypothetical protein
MEPEPEQRGKEQSVIERRGFPPLGSSDKAVHTRQAGGVSMPANCGSVLLQTLLWRPGSSDVSYFKERSARSPLLWGPLSPRATHGSSVYRRFLGTGP